MSYFSENVIISPELFKIIQLTQTLTPEQFSKLCEVAVSKIVSDDKIVDYVATFSGMAQQRFCVLAALIYFAKAEQLVAKKHSSQLLFALSYKVACQMYGIELSSPAATRLTGFSYKELNRATLTFCELMKFSFFINFEDFMEFSKSFYDEYQSEIQEFRHKTLEDLLYEPKQLRDDFLQDFENDVWLQMFEQAEAGKGCALQGMIE